MADVQFALLKQFVAACRADPSILHKPEMAFYREYLERYWNRNLFFICILSFALSYSLGASIPPPKPADSPRDKPSSEQQHDKAKMEESPVEEEPMEIPPPELDNSGVIEPDEGSPLPMGDTSRASTDEDLEKANELRDQANAAFSEGIR